MTNITPLNQCPLCTEKQTKTIQICFIINQSIQYVSKII